MLKLIILLILLCFSCHFVVPEECIKACRPKGVKNFSNIGIGVFYNGGECKATHIETENKGYNIRIEEIKKR